MINFIRNFLKDFYHYVKGNRLPDLKKSENLLILKTKIIKIY